MKSWLIIPLLLVASCVTQQLISFKGRYAKFLPADEKEIFSAYHFMTSSKNDGSAVFRSFYPEQMLMTSEVRFMDASFTVRQGNAMYWHENGRKSKEGQFVNNLESGEWKFFHRKSDELSFVGEYEEGLEVGEWTYYDEKGRIKEKSNFIYGLRFGEFIEFDSLGQIINQGMYYNDSIVSQSRVFESLLDSVVEVMPFIMTCSHIENLLERKKCSDETLLKYIYTNVKYPRKAREYGLEGVTYTQFVIEKDGLISNIEPIIALSDLLKHECIRVLEGLPPFSPGLQKGEPVRVLFTLPITFKLD